MDVFGGCAAFCGIGSPLTHAVGLGIGLNLTAVECEAELARLEQFFRAREATPNLEISTLAEFHLLELLVQRGYQPFEWNHVLWRKLEQGEWLPPSRVEVRRTADPEAWSLTLLRGFLGRELVTSEELAIGFALFHASGARAYTAYVDGVAAGCGLLSLHDGVGLFHADSTLNEFRGRGVQAALIRARLIDAVAAGAWVATAATGPGTVSQRNYERQGFHVLYARQGLARESK